MNILRLTQNPPVEGKYIIEISLEGDGIPRKTANVAVEFNLTPDEQEDIRWYVEDFLQFPFDPAPKKAKRIEKRLTGIGTQLFNSIFGENGDARDMWPLIRDKLDNTRVEIVTGVEQATSIPWELIRDPKTDKPLALRARSFVRAFSNPQQTPRIPDIQQIPVRILLIICRPGKGVDVPFRSVASRLIKGLTKAAKESFILDVLRPPTFEALGKKLREAKNNGLPYHIVHFDGHGDYFEQTPEMQFLKVKDGTHGYLAFENPKSDDNSLYVDGPSLGSLLVETGVPVLVLNACRSALSEGISELQKEIENPHDLIRAIGSFAQEVMDTGVSGVVAMRYSVFVLTAAQFVADMYIWLAQGNSLGHSVTLSRKMLSENPHRPGSMIEWRLRDWFVPVVFEADEIKIFPPPSKEISLKINIEAGETSSGRGPLDPSLPKDPDTGFFGRDETLLALDRAFDDHRIVLLHAYAGSGKTTAAAEFARWYSLTGGIEGPVLFTKFEQHKTLPRVLDQLEIWFGQMLEQKGINWLALSDKERKDYALQILNQIPVLWIWDNVEPIAGFPVGSQSAWSDEEKKELVDFLRDVRNTKAKFLLTSRRDESVWLGENLPRRIKVPPMPMYERIELAQAIVEKHDQDVNILSIFPIFEYSKGNPLTLTVLIGQVLKQKMTSSEQIDAFINALRSGEAQIHDDESEGREKSLGASLKYGFENAFNENELKQLAMLHFFQGFVDVDALCYMGNTENEFSLPEMEGLSRDDVITLLDKAAEIGLLTALGGGYYSIHPAMPWFLNSLFTKYYKDKKDEVTRTFVETIGSIGNYYHYQYEDGNRDVIGNLRAEEPNLLYARQLARSNGWWDSVTNTMQGLHQLYDHTGRTQWARLVNEIIPDFIDPSTNKPLIGRESNYIFVMDYLIRLTRESKNMEEAEKLMVIFVDWIRTKAAPSIKKSPEDFNNNDCHFIRALAVGLENLGDIQRAQGKGKCVKSLEEAVILDQLINDKPHEATTSFNLGNSYLTIIEIRDFAEAEKWYKRSLELNEKNDYIGQARCYGNLGYASRMHFVEARKSNQPEEKQLQNLSDSLDYSLKALTLTPTDALYLLSVINNQLGLIFSHVGELDKSLFHYQESIKNCEKTGNNFNAGQTRTNVAILLANNERYEDALDYANAALRNFETFGDRAASDIQQTKELIDLIMQSRDEHQGQ